MFHIHCGPPGVLGPIIVDFSQFGLLTKTIVDGHFSATLTDDSLTYVTSGPNLMAPSQPESCPQELGFPTQTKTIAGLKYLARKGVLYFNLHTKAHTYYGEMRGQIYPEPS